MLEALIPYIEAPERTLVEHVPLLDGPLKLQVFGPLVATGVILGWFRGLKYARLKDMDEWLVRDYMWWQLVIAFAFGHWVSVIFYFPHEIEKNPWVLLAFWNGLSSVGGFFGGLVGMLWFLRKHKQPILPYADLSTFGLLLGWCFGRLGCSLVHDHPGRVVEAGTFLAVGPWPDGTWRYDLGLYEWFFTVALTVYVHLIAKDVHKWQPGRLIGLVVVLYTPFRFGLDFLRAVEPARNVIGTPDPRYAGLTTAQWFTIAFFLLGLWLLLIRKPKATDFQWTRGSDREKQAAVPATDTPTTTGESERASTSEGEPDADTPADP